jgi:hypothetical protein
MMIQPDAATQPRGNVVPIKPSTGEFPIQLGPGGFPSQTADYFLIPISRLPDAGRKPHAGDYAFEVSLTAAPAVRLFVIVVPGESVNITEIREYYVTDEIALPAREGVAGHLVGLNGGTADRLFKAGNTVGVVVIPESAPAQVTVGKIVRRALKHHNQAKPSKQAGR